jgi:hypothetical protein
MPIQKGAAALPPHACKGRDRRAAELEDEMEF